jgi:hypothetical protein
MERTTDRVWFFIGDGECDCVTRDGKQVPAPQTAR